MQQQPKAAASQVQVDPALVEAIMKVVMDTLSAKRTEEIFVKQQPFAGTVKIAADVAEATNVEATVAGAPEAGASDAGASKGKGPKAKKLKVKHAPIRSSSRIRSGASKQ